MVCQLHKEISNDLKGKLKTFLKGELRTSDKIVDALALQGYAFAPRPEASYVEIYYIDLNDKLIHEGKFRKHGKVVRLIEEMIQFRTEYVKCKPTPLMNEMNLKANYLKKKLNWEIIWSSAIDQDCLANEGIKYLLRKRASTDSFLKIATKIEVFTS